jgi:hypothetical protein
MVTKKRWFARTTAGKTNKKQWAGDGLSAAVRVFTTRRALPVSRII